MAHKRQCPVCAEVLVYANLPGFRRATRTRALCRKCAASPSVVQKKLAEAQQQAAKKSTAKFMEAFFEKLEASISGSHHR